MVKPAKNTICLWYDGAPRTRRGSTPSTFPDSSVSAVHRAPGDYPPGKKGDVLTVEFTVMGVPCLGLNGGPAFERNVAFSFQVATVIKPKRIATGKRRSSGRRPGEPVRLVQGQMGIVLADYAPIALTKRSPIPIPRSPSARSLP